MALAGELAKTIGGRAVVHPPFLTATIRLPGFHIDLITLPRQPRGYGPQDHQVYGADNGPNCVQATASSSTSRTLA